MSCDREAQVQTYYDDELPAEQRADVEQHLRGCGECTTFLLELRTLTNAVRGVDRATMDPAAMRRLEQAWWRRRDRGVLRLAEVLTAAAAAVIFATLYFTSDAGDSSPEPSPRAMAWQTDALIPPVETRDEAASEIVVLAEWMANDLSPEAR